MSVWNSLGANQDVRWLFHGQDKAFWMVPLATRHERAAGSSRERHTSRPRFQFFLRPLHGSKYGTVRGNLAIPQFICDITVDVFFLCVYMQEANQDLPSDELVTMRCLWIQGAGKECVLAMQMLR